MVYAPSYDLKNGPIEIIPPTNDISGNINLTKKEKQSRYRNNCNNLKISGYKRADSADSSYFSNSPNVSRIDCLQPA